MTLLFTHSIIHIVILHCEKSSKVSKELKYLYVYKNAFYKREFKDSHCSY